MSDNQFRTQVILERSLFGLRPQRLLSNNTVFFTNYLILQVTELLTEIGVPSIISQKTRNIGPELVEYWPTPKTLEIHYTDAGPMRPFCRVPDSTSQTAR